MMGRVCLYVFVWFVDVCVCLYAFVWVLDVCVCISVPSISQVCAKDECTLEYRWPCGMVALPRRVAVVAAAATLWWCWGRVGMCGGQSIELIRGVRSANRHGGG